MNKLHDPVGFLRTAVGLILAAVPIACPSAAIGVIFVATLVPCAHADEKPPACGQDTHFSQQDFALGDWDVYTRKQRHWTLKLRADGSIQELSVGSTDGQNWSKEYELIWRKRKGSHE